MLPSSKPPFLYHGSPRLQDHLEPHPAPGVGPEKDKLSAIYASHLEQYAIPFALPIIPKVGGGYAWSMDFIDGVPRVKLMAGALDLDNYGYLYRVHSLTFEPVDEFQWVSFVPIIPIDYKIIHPRDYLNWFVT